MEENRIYLRSDNGMIIADLDGEVISSSSSWRGAQASAPEKLDVEEWLRNSPYHNGAIARDELAGMHDILDFGFWDRNGVYTPPCKDWRELMTENERNSVSFTP